MLHRDRLAGFQVAHCQLGVRIFGLEKSRRLDRQLLPVAIAARCAVDRDLVAGAGGLHFRRFFSDAVSQTKRAPPERGSVPSSHRSRKQHCAPTWRFAPAAIWGCGKGLLTSRESARKSAAILTLKPLGPRSVSTAMSPYKAPQGAHEACRIDRLLRAGAVPKTSIAFACRRAATSPVHPTDAPASHRRRATPFFRSLG